MFKTSNHTRSQSEAIELKGSHDSNSINPLLLSKQNDDLKFPNILQPNGDNDNIEITNDKLLEYEASLSYTPPQGND